MATSPGDLEFADLYDQLKSGRLSFSVEEHSVLYLHLESFLVRTYQKERVESEYLGDRVDGKPDGLGIMIYPGRMKVYVGQWRNGKRHGKGFMNYSLDERYVGDWEDDARHGYGITVFEGTRVAVYYIEWKGQYKNDKWEGEAELEERARQRYPLRKALERDDLKQIEKEVKSLEHKGETDAAFKLSAKLRAFESLHRGFDKIWEGFSTHYPSKYPDLNKTIEIKPVGAWCAECNRFIDRNSEGDSDLPEVVFSSVLPDLKQFKSSESRKASQKEDFEVFGGEHFDAPQEERFADIYARCLWHTNLALSQRYLLGFINRLASLVEEHLRSHHQWDSPDPKLLFEKMEVSGWGNSRDLVLSEKQPRFFD